MATRETLWSVPEAARHLGVSRSFVYRHLEEIPHIRVGDRTTRFRPADLDAWLSTRQVVHLPTGEAVEA